MCLPYRIGSHAIHWHSKSFHTIVQLTSDGGNRSLAGKFSADHSLAPSLSEMWVPSQMPAHVLELPLSSTGGGMNGGSSQAGRPLTAAGTLAGPRRSVSSYLSDQLWTRSSPINTRHSVTIKVSTTGGAMGAAGTPRSTRFSDVSMRFSRAQRVAQVFVYPMSPAIPDAPSRGIYASSSQRQSRAVYCGRNHTLHTRGITAPPCWSLLWCRCQGHSTVGNLTTTGNHD